MLRCSYGDANMSTHKPDVEDEVSRLASVGREQGRPDRSLGRQRWTRWTARVRLEVSSDPSHPSDSWPAAMQEVLPGGVGFWSKCTFEEGDVLYIREWGQDQDWLPVRVVDCTQCKGGILIGVEFDTPAPLE